jgi:hypothetical protein
MKLLMDEAERHIQDQKDKTSWGHGHNSRRNMTEYRNVLFLLEMCMNDKFEAIHKISMG